MGTVGSTWFARTGTSAYQGDGVISKIKFLPNPGIKVEFEKFSLSRPYSKTYRLEGLPRHRSDYFVGLAVAVEQPDFDQNPRAVLERPAGTLHLVLRDGSGTSLFDCQRPVNQIQWTWVAGERLGWFGKVAGPRSETSKIFPADLKSPQPPTTLEVQYEPAPESPDVSAWVRVVAGGQK